MKVLLVGDRAREHILAEQLARSSELYAAMQYRNPGIERAAVKFFLCDFSNIEAIGGWAIRENIDIALVTSETALAKGLSEALHEIGIKTASPPAAGSLMGENTVYARNIMQEAGVPIPRFAVCKSDKEVKAAMKEMPRMVMKPALKVEWKGTRFGDTDFKTAPEIMKYAKQMMKRQGSVVVEEVVDGESFSMQGMTDGKTLALMPPVHTAKRLLENNQGALTEGMGGFSSGTILPFLKKPDLDSARDCIWKLISKLRSKGVDYRGPIRGEFFATRQGVVMMEAYATMGGVTTLNNMMLLRSQISETLTSIVEGSLKPMTFWEKATVVKFLVPPGYPEKPKKTGFVMDDRALWNNGAKAYFESVDVEKAPPGAESDVLSGAKNRTLAICASGADLAEAESKAEDAADSVKGYLHHREDVAGSGYVNRLVKHMALLRAER